MTKWQNIQNDIMKMKPTDGFRSCTYNTIRIINQYNPMIVQQEISKSPVFTLLNSLVSYHACMHDHMRGGTKQGGQITGHDCVWLDQWNTHIYVRDKSIKGIEVDIKILIPLDRRKVLKNVKIGRISKYRMKNT